MSRSWAIDFSTRMVTMGNNFLAMPSPLKLLVMATLVGPAYVVTSIVSLQSINVFGREVSTSEWWSCGAGPMALAVVGLMLAAALLTLTRSRLGRQIYILAWLALSASIPLTAQLIRIDVSYSLPSLTSNLVLTASIGLYFYRNRTAQNYFMSPGRADRDPPSA